MAPSVLLLATAQNLVAPVPEQTEFHVASAAERRMLHVLPSFDVITRLPVPLFATATNILVSDDQHTDVQLFALTPAPKYHVIPSPEYAAIAPPLTAQKIPSSGDQHTDV